MNPNGSSCPVALRLIACVLLLEITSFMRETYKNLPKLHKHHLFTGASAPTSGVGVTGGAGGHSRLVESRASHAWSSAVSSVAAAAASVNAPLLPPPAAAGSNRRWSIALQSVNQTGQPPAVPPPAKAEPTNPVLEKASSLSSQVKIFAIG